MGKEKKPKGKPRGDSWGADNPPPVSPGGPKKPDAELLVREALEAEPGIPEKLVAARVVLNWLHPSHPKHGLAKFYFDLRKKSPREFQATWERLEAEWESQKAVGITRPEATVAVVAAPPVLSLVAEGEEPLEMTEGDEELRASIIELLKRHAARAKQ